MGVRACARAQCISSRSRCARDSSGRFSFLATIVVVLTSRILSIMSGHLDYAGLARQPGSPGANYSFSLSSAYAMFYTYIYIYVARAECHTYTRNVIIILLSARACATINVIASFNYCTESLDKYNYALRLHIHTPNTAHTYNTCITHNEGI